MTARRLLAALLIALVASGLFTLWVGKRMRKPAVVAVPQLRYAASLDNLNAGQTLEKAELNLVDWPADKPLKGGFAKPEDLAGRTVLFPLSAGEPILERDLAAAGSGSGLTTRIPPGMRAISLKSDEVVGVAGFLLPGTHVDVLVTYHGTGPQGGVATTTVLQDTQILAAGQKMQPDPEGKPSSVDVVTLLVSPDGRGARGAGEFAGSCCTLCCAMARITPSVTEHMAQLPEFGGTGAALRPGPRRARSVAHDRRQSLRRSQTSEALRRADPLRRQAENGDISVNDQASTH